MERGRSHEWPVVESTAICRKHDLSVRGGKSELMKFVKVYFQGLSLHLMKKIASVLLELCKVRRDGMKSWNTWGGVATNS